MRPKLNSGGTTLTTIAKHVVWVDCACGRAGRVLISEVLARPNPPKTVGELVAKARCRACGAAVPTGYSIVYEGASEGAMRGGAPLAHLRGGVGAGQGRDRRGGADRA